MCLDRYIQPTEAELWDVWTDVHCMMDISSGTEGMCLDRYIQPTEAELWDVWTDVHCMMDISSGTEGMCLDRYIQPTEAELWDVWTDVHCMMDISSGTAIFIFSRQKHNPCWTSCRSSGGDPMIPHTFSLTPQHSFISQRSGWTRTSNLSNHEAALLPVSHRSLV
ncbi:uncharacterized protein LOC143741954 isoform X3 [Siphateles boraxobius]